MKIFSTPVKRPYKGHFFGIKKFEKSWPQRGFPPKIEVGKFMFFYSILHIHSLRPMNGPLWCPLWELLLKIHEFYKKCSGRKPFSGLDFWNFSLPDNFSQHGELTGVKISTPHFVCIGWQTDMTSDNLSLCQQIALFSINKVCPTVLLTVWPSFDAA